jgi:G:T-mismatch repair DNA endonuclease (very short patch repair protein)
MTIMIRVKCNEKYLSYIDEKGGIYFEDGRRVKRDECDKIEIECNNCQKISNWTSIPNKSYLLKDEFLCKSCRQIGEKNPQYGKKWNEDRKNIRSESMRGDKNHMFGKTFYDIWLEKYGKVRADILLDSHKEKSKKIGVENGMWGRKFYDVWLEKYGKEEADIRLKEFNLKKKEWIKDNPEHLQRMIINSHLRKYRKTSIEKKVESFLKETKVNYTYNFILENKYQFDFYIQELNLIIETHGDYWHANPIYYSDQDQNKKNLNETQKYKVELDEMKYRFVKEHNKNILYLWETDIKNNNFKEILKTYGIY